MLMTSGFNLHRTMRIDNYLVNIKAKRVVVMTMYNYYYRDPSKAQIVVLYNRKSYIFRIFQGLK